jgi:hypothetical protein
MFAIQLYKGIMVITMYLLVTVRLIGEYYIYAPKLHAPRHHPTKKPTKFDQETFSLLRVKTKSGPINSWHNTIKWRNIFASICSLVLSLWIWHVESSWVTSTSKTWRSEVRKRLLNNKANLVQPFYFKSSNFNKAQWKVNRINVKGCKRELKRSSKRCQLTP